MAKNKDVHMTEDVQLELRNIEGRLELAMQKSIHTAIKEGFREIKDHIAELFNKDINHINDHLSRHDKYHKEHYDEKDKLWDAIGNLKFVIPDSVKLQIEDLSEEVEILNQFKLETSVIKKTEDVIKDKNHRDKNLSYTKVGLLIAASTMIGGAITFLSTLLFM